ncbi:MAG: methyltransferase domain-containing protein [Candidatus Absconditabacterales bacterium]
MKKCIKDRHDYIMQYCKDKHVLHLGCIGNSYKSTSEYEPWLHKEICEVAKECVGLDSDKERIPFVEERTKSKIFFGDVQYFDLSRKFDVIVGGEIIEHLDNFKSFFESIKKHMNKESLLVLTTPNAFNFSNLIRVIFTGKPIFDKDHVVYFDLFTLGQMLKRHGFKLVAHYYNTEVAPQRIRNMIIRGLGKIFPILNLDLMIVAKCVESAE